MTDLTPNAVVSGLMELSRELAELSKGLDELEADMVNAREDFTLAHAKAYLAAEGSVETRKAIAITETHNERLTAETAEALVRGRKRQMQTLLARIDVGRSAAAALRAEISLGGVH